ncbi:proline-rich receptor-like protein kinase PERK4 [Lycium ferocissimum]|uniref:proline-rich receptor-like protein kinase PERK4 n=1 Tax=Lycium ferocissimum TaxID=112874 RepID=UPI002814F32F|nr:proline-rich receptor-like protein kinase PERK4 [Lycium ferocissimum]
MGEKMDSSPGSASSNDTDSSDSPPNNSNGTSPSSSSPPSDNNSSPPKNDSPPSSSSPPPSQSPPPSSPPPSQSPPPSSPDSSPPPQSPPPSSPPPSDSSSSSPPKDNNNNNNNQSPQSPPPSSNNSPSQSPPPSSNNNTPSPPNAPKNNNNGSPPSAIFSPPNPASSRESPPAPLAHLSPPSHPGSSEKSPDSSSGNNNNSSPPDSSGNNVAIIAGLAVGGILIIAFIIFCVWCSRRKKKQRYYMGPGPKGGEQYYNNNNQWNRRASMDHVMKVPQGEMGTQGGWAAATPHQATNSSSEFGSGYSGQAGALPPQSPNVNVGGLGGFSQSQFTYEELAKATDGFSQANLLGQGGFGYVHKGVLTDGRIVAIKSLKAGSGQGEREFQAEVEIISRVHHRHLVSLVGYCIANGQRMLVYEYVDNKTLEFHLHGKGQPVMDWETRLKIALGSAKGLAYLHEDCQHRIIHRDIKAANILLDLNYEALVADFGLAKLTSDNNTHVSTRVMGTFGYLAPEYASSGKLTEKSDVFSYGVMLLELITGKRPVDPSNMMEDSLVDWARPLLTRALEEGIYDELVDARLEGNYDTDELHRMIACGAASIRHSAKRRPKMSQIVRALEGNSSLEDLNDNAKPGKTPSFAASSTSATSAYDTGMYNADMMKFRKMILPTQEFNSSEHGTPSE